MNYESDSWSFGPGLFPDVFHEVQNILNFTYSLRKPADGKWGSKVRVDGKPDTFTGMVGELWKQTADLSVGDWIQTTDINNAVDFSPPVNHDKIMFYIKSIDFNQLNWHPYTQSFSHFVWALLVCVIFLVAILMHFAIKFGGKKKNEEEFLRTKSLIFAIGSLTFIRRWSVTPVAISARIIFITGIS